LQLLNQVDKWKPEKFYCPKVIKTVSEGKKGKERFEFAFWTVSTLEKSEECEGFLFKVFLTCHKQSTIKSFKLNSMEVTS
jgi:hypothetical protein